MKSGLSETQHQIAVLKWSQQPSIRERYDELKLLFHIKNESGEGARTGAVSKMMGVKKGVPDLLLPVARGTFHGLFVEMKTATGRLSPEQRWWGEQLRRQGYSVEVCYGYESAILTIENYLKMGVYHQ